MLCYILRPKAKHIFFCPPDSRVMHMYHEPRAVGIFSARCGVASCENCWVTREFRLRATERLRATAGSSFPYLLRKDASAQVVCCSL